MVTLPTSTNALVFHDPIVRPRRELLTEFEPGEFLLVLDNSGIETVTTCPRYAYHYLLLEREGHARNAAQTFGGAVHVGLEHQLLGESDDQVNHHVLKYFTENPAPPDEYRTLSCAIELLQHYRVRAMLPDYQCELMFVGEHPLVEQAFEIPIAVYKVEKTIQLPKWDTPRLVNHIHVAWSGRLDAIIKTRMLSDSPEGRNRVMDHKTTVMAGDQFVQDFQLSNPTLGYVWAAQKLWPELHISGFCLNAIHLKKHKAGTPLLTKGPRGGEPPLNFFRAYFDYAPQRISQWEDNTKLVMKNFINRLVANEWPMHTKSCFGKYGKCQYHDLCCMDDPAVRSHYLQSDAFKDVTWNPTASR